jgi:eukaryotic-like serine/threonine-protein kinase
MIGQNLLHYRITEKIGEGGMGVVYKATDTHLDRVVAIKVLPPDKTADPERKRRFVLEAKAASALHHPNIVVIHDIASDRGVDFIVMEYVDGPSLDRLIGRRGLKLDAALGYAVQIADGLAKAHAAGIVHRDLKPTNVMIASGGLVKILDFGLAKLAEPGPPALEAATVTLAQAEKPRTEEGFVVGTAAYMSPEQAEGGAVDARSDIFSFGVLFYEMLTGQKPFQRESRMKTLAAVLSEEPKAASAVNDAVPADAEHILSRCLRKDPQRRWQTASDLKVALQDLKEDSESGKLRAVERPARRRGPRLIPILAGALVLVAAGALIVRQFVIKPAQSAAYESTRLTFDSGQTLSPAISPDGKFVAYASDREGDGALNLWVLQVSGGKPLRLTNQPATDWLPDFSPDGSKIVFRSERDGGGIDVIDVLGGEPRRLTKRGLHPRFSPDGSQIAFLDVPASLETRLCDVYLIPAMGGTPRPFHPEFSILSTGTGSAPVWSPDGKTLLFRAVRDDEPDSGDWWVFPLDGSAPVKTGAQKSLGLPDYVQYPCGWLGSEIYYIVGSTVEGINIFKAAIDPKTSTIKGPGLPLTSGPGMKIFVSLSRDGRLAYANMTAIMDAWSVSARPDEGIVGRDLRKITSDLMPKFNPSLSRDGTKIAFSAFGGLKGTRIDVRWMDIPSGKATILPTLGQLLSFAQYPRLSPDGTRLAYRDFISGQWHTFILAQGSESGTDLGPIGRVVDFFTGSDDLLVRTKPNELVRRNLKTSQATPALTIPAGFINDGHLSADNRWFVFRSGLPDGRAAISIVPLGPTAAAPRDIVTIIESDRYLGNPRWSPNGRFIYFLSETGGRCGLYTQELDPRTKKPLGLPRAVFFTSGARFGLNYPMGNSFIDVAADKVIFSLDEATGNIFLVSPIAK